MEGPDDLERFVTAQAPVYHEVLAAPGTAEDVLGQVDALKLRSCATLFDRAAGGDPDARAVLERWWAGEPDPATLRLLDPTDAEGR